MDVAAMKALSYDFKGLATAPGQLARPPGSLSSAINCNAPAPGLLEKRNGFARQSNGFGGPAWAFVSTKQLGSNLLMNFGSSTEATGLRYGDGSAATTLLTTPDGANVTNQPATRMKVAVSLKNHYITQDNGPLRLESDYGLDYAGMPLSPGFDMARVTTVLPAAGGFLDDQHAVAYRAVFGTRDADGVEMLGAPSGRLIVSNTNQWSGYTGAASDVVLRVIFPQHVNTTGANFAGQTKITTSYFVQLYRSKATDVAVGLPNDELQLVCQYDLSASDISNGRTVITDICPVSAMGAFLYTNTISGGDNASGALVATTRVEGTLAANDPPPLAKDVAQFADCLVYIDIQTRQRLVFSLLGVGGSGVSQGLSVGDIVTVDGIAYTAVAGAPASALEFTVYLAGSASDNIRQTATNLVEAINANRYQGAATNQTIDAQYIGNNTSPGTVGRILLQRKNVAASSFTVTVSAHPAGYVPRADNGLTSSCDTWRNGVAISKPLQADAVPPANFLRIGTPNTVIQRVVALSNAVYFFTDEGVWWMRGSGPSDFVIEPFDQTFRLLCRDACVAQGDEIYAWGAEGIAVISSGGTRYIDLPIRDLVQYQVVQNSSIGAGAFAVAYRNQRRVLFFFSPSSVKPYDAVGAFVWNMATEQWTTYSLTQDSTSMNCGAVRYSDETLFLGNWNGSSTDAYVFKELINTGNDYHDTNRAGTDVAISMTVVWNPVAPDPAELFQWRELQVTQSPPNTSANAEKNTAAAFSASFASELEVSASTVAITGNTTFNTRVLVGQSVATCSRPTITVTHSTIDDYFSVGGLALRYLPISEATVR